MGIYVPDGEMTEAEQVCFDAGWATPLQATTLREALRLIRASTYSTDNGCALKADAVAEICKIATDALVLCPASARGNESDVGNGNG